METGWTHFELREYDPMLGRWMATDPAAQYWSPYTAMGNDPINGIDPDGAFKTRFGAWVYSVFNGGDVVNNGDEWHVNMLDADLNPSTAFDWGGGLGGSYMNGFAAGAHNTWEGVKHQFTWDGVVDNIFWQQRMAEQSTQLLMSGYDLVSKLPDYDANDYAYGLGFATEKVAEIYLTKKLVSSNISIKPLRGPGGNLNGLTISRGTGYGAKPRFDVHPLGNASKVKNSMPSWTKARHCLIIIGEKEIISIGIGHGKKDGMIKVSGIDFSYWL